MPGRNRQSRWRTITFSHSRPAAPTTLNGNLRLENNNINIEAGATFSGAGRSSFPTAATWWPTTWPTSASLLDMQGAFRPGNSEGIGRVDLFDYQQANTGELYVELTGNCAQCVRSLWSLSGDAVVDGYLNIDIDEFAGSSCRRSVRRSTSSPATR